MQKSFIELIENSIKDYWDLPALTDYKGATHRYKDVARQIEKLHILFEQGGIKKGDKIALCSRNSSNWGITFLAILTYGATAVPILHEFKADNIHHIINHSGSKLLFAGDSVWNTIDHKHMPALEGIIRMEDYTIRHARTETITAAQKQANRQCEKQHAGHIRYRREDPDEIALINYTSGTSSASKGVLLPYLSLWSNLRFALDQLGYNPGEKLVSILTMAHMYGLAFEFIYPFTSGNQIFFLSKIPSPRIIAEVFSTVRPHLIVAVPLVIEKIIRNQVLPKLKRPHIRLFLKIPLINKPLQARIRQKVLDAFGGRFKLLAVGGAALNHEVESFLFSIRFPFTVGYGMTECGPGISFDHWQTFRPGSCGKAVARMEIKIDSPNARQIAGEIIVKGENVMKGYYKNPEATAEAIDPEGWLHTGDLGILDEAGYLYIKGRSKNTILGSSGQNIYPEEIEDKLNVMPYVSESLVISENGKLIALIHPEAEAVKRSRLSPEEVYKQLEHSRKMLNRELPAYSQISRIRIRQEEFEKTPKKSIKRYLYQPQPSL
ncbi:MAG: AMP-binding protein [Culturomica sp.]|jgi:long-chain acyl-CoA synthetase|nr:AMP-binding protein [Culturomica sp.]